MPEPTDPTQDEEFMNWARRVRAHVLPKIQDSALTVSLVPEETDIKFAVELGISIMLDKPIIAVVRPGTKVPSKLVAVADRIVEADLDGQPGEMKKLMAAIETMMKEIDEE